MKNTTNISSYFSPLSVVMACLMMVFFVFDSKATVYTSIADGSYNDCSIWDNGCPGNLIPVGDTVIINNDIGASSTMSIRGVLIINSSGSLAISNYAEIQETGTMINEGDFVCNAEFEINGYFYQSGLATIQYLHNDGYLCNSGTINISDRVRNHGGTIECDGNIFTCELDMENNNGALAVTGTVGSSIAGQDVCCTSGGAVNPFDDLEDDWLIDSISVAICELPLIPNAGEDGNASICNSIGSEIDLNTLLTGNNTVGSFSETTSSGAFDNVSGILNAEGLLAGDYNFVFNAPGYDGTSDQSEFTITILPVLEGSETISICPSELPFVWNGLSFSEAGSQSVTLSSTFGCDSTVTLNLFVNAIPTSMNDTLVCGSQLPFIWNGATINEAGSETVTLIGSNGCDSLATINVELELLEAPVIDFSGPVSCPKDLVSFSIANENSDAVYEWSGPEGFISNAIFNEFELTENLMGSYAVSYTLNSCVSETSYIDLEIENLFEYEAFKFPNVITANGDDINDKIVLEDFIGACSDFLLTIRDRWGSEVYRQERGEESFRGLSVDGSELPEGTYFYRLVFPQGDVSGFMHIVR
ncbi:gliding motility-associated C-terminal domain-containing protein [Crocinitomicaceae bacterium]|nr:gliding motility-associated C-terminal domain-containing protein [Crocinitomicaceae bacterium]